MKVCLGGPTPAEHEALVAERDLLKKELAEARQQIEDLKVRMHWVLHHIRHQLHAQCLDVRACVSSPSC
jgi:hypothetical protein